MSTRVTESVPVESRLRSRGAQTGSNFFVTELLPSLVRADFLLTVLFVENKITERNSTLRGAPFLV